LRALQSGEVCRVGSEHVIHVDVRVMAATNKDLEREVAASRFRDDLFFRLNVFPIRSPALRERTEDIRPLADAFVATFCKENGLKRKPIDSTVYKALETRTWPGNVRELKNVVERAAILSSDVITIADLPEEPHANPFEDEPAGQEGLDEQDEMAGERATDALPAASPSGERLTLREYREQSERRYIVDTLRSLEWNISRTAVVLGVERTNLHKKIRAYGIKRGET
jgi:two-component system, NtrC family, nitrogen regulation response regulator NtrX